MTRRYRVEGRVQGVGFRYFTRQHASRLGLSGWVRNTEDGGLEALATGSAAEFAEFESQLRRGPPAALVTYLHVVETPDEVDSSGAFRVI